MKGRQLEKLVSGAQRGQVEAFEGLYSAFGGRILSYCLRMTGSRENAEDLTQETFILAFKNLRSLKEPAKFQSWLYRIAQNSVFQSFRTKKFPVESLDRDTDDQQSAAEKLPAHARTPEEAVLSVELENVIQRAIDSLPEKYRTVFVLSAIQRLSYDEISTIVERSLASVKSDIHRARVLVRDRVKEYLGEDYGVSRLH